MTKGRTMKDSEIVDKVLDLLQDYYGKRPASEFFTYAPGELFAVIESILQAGLELGAYGTEVVPSTRDMIVKRLNKLSEVAEKTHDQEVEEFINSFDEGMEFKDKLKKILN